MTSDLDRFLIKIKEKDIFIRCCARYYINRVGNSSSVSGRIHVCKEGKQNDKIFWNDAVL